MRRTDFHHFLIGVRAAAAVGDVYSRGFSEPTFNIIPS